MFSIIVFSFFFFFLLITYYSNENIGFFIPYFIAEYFYTQKSNFERLVIYLKKII